MKAKSNNITNDGFFISEKNDNDREENYKIDVDLRDEYVSVE